MVTVKQEDLSSMLEKNLKEQLRNANNRSNTNKVAAQALKTFDKVYKSKQNIEKSA